MALCDDAVVYISPSYSTTKICQLNTPNKTNENNENKINKIRIHRFQEPYKLHVYTYMPWVNFEVPKTFPARCQVAEALISASSYDAKI